MNNNRDCRVGQLTKNPPFWRSCGLGGKPPLQERKKGSIFFSLFNFSCLRGMLLRFPKNYTPRVIDYLGFSAFQSASLATLLQNRLQCDPISSQYIEIVKKNVTNIRILGLQLHTIYILSTLSNCKMFLLFSR